MSPKRNRQWLIDGDPSGRAVRLSDFKRVETSIPSLEEGELSVRVDYLEFSPSLKGQMENRLHYAAPTSQGSVMRGRGTGTVIESRAQNYPVGRKVKGYLGWQDVATVKASEMESVPDDKYLRARLGPLGSSGMTAYFGFLEAGKPQENDTVLISGAAGAVGSMVGQIAKIRGCKVIGVAGGPEKCRWLVEDAGLDGAVDYKLEDMETRFKELMPSGANIVFDNVGGEFLNHALNNIATGARVVICGAMSRYETSAHQGPANYFNLVLQRATMQGILSPFYKAHFPKAVKDIQGWMESGEFVYKEDIQNGFENIPASFLRLFSGKNIGKQLIKLSD